MRLHKANSQTDAGQLNSLPSSENQSTNTETAPSSSRLLSPIVSIQRAWRIYRDSRQDVKLSGRNSRSTSKSQSEAEDLSLSETDSSSGVQMMSLSSAEYSDRNTKSEDDLHTDDLDSTSGNETSNSPEPENFFAASYSLAARCGIESEPESIVSDYSEMADPIKEHLANVQIIQKEDLDMGNTFSEQCIVQSKMFRGSDEDEEEYSRRVRKTNFLSLAQEFAALKKVNADALPFDLHKDVYQDVSPMSDTDSGSEIDSVEKMTSLDIKDNSDAPLSGKCSSAQNNESEMGAAMCESIPDIVPGSIGQVGKLPDASFVTSSIDGTSGKENSNPRSIPGLGSFPKIDQSSPKRMEESLEEFDVYTIETALPQMDWHHLEEQLQRAAEEEQQKWSRCGDREEIRRKLAMSADDDCFGHEQSLQKLNFHARLQGSMNLQMCFVNEAAVEQDDRSFASNHLPCQGSNAKPDVIPIYAPAEEQMNRMSSSSEENEDFFSKQARLQAEAKMALAQVRPMAHMQLQLEKQRKKKSPLAEIVGIPGFVDGKFRRLGLSMLQRMNFAQLQVVVNDLHAQIEVLNGELMQQLVDRDDLHMAQDSMLVDIEDLTGRAQEFAARVNKRRESNKYV